MGPSVTLIRSLVPFFLEGWTGLGGARLSGRPLAGW
jgi:hypothetical protein